MPEPVQPELSYIPHELFVADVRAVGAQLEGGDWRPDFLVGIGRGGLVPAAYLSHLVAIPLLSVDHSSGEPGFGEELLGKLAAKIERGCRILIVDDINDSGATVAHLRKAIEDRAGADSERLRVAVLVNNIRSRARVEYHSRQIDRSVDKRWFVFPWEAMAPAAALVEDATAVPERLA